jgi:hypothetical protein
MIWLWGFVTVLVMLAVLIGVAVGWMEATATANRRAELARHAMEAEAEELRHAIWSAINAFATPPRGDRVTWPTGSYEAEVIEGLADVVGKSEARARGRQ